jgi:hypothetical protein
MMAIPLVEKKSLHVITEEILRFWRRRRKRAESSKEMKKMGHEEEEEKERCTKTRD